MAAQAAPGNGPRRNLPRLNIINPSISYSQQQAQALFSPALQTAIHTGTGSGFPLHTPMQPYFNGPMHPPPAPARHGHHQGRASISHFPGGQSMVTPTVGHFPRPSIMLGHGPQSYGIGLGGPGQPIGPITVNNGPPPPGHRPHRRQMSIGGPPKAVLGGPQRKVSPNPAATAITSGSSKKKMTVNLPKESEVVDAEADTTAATDEETADQTEETVDKKMRVLKEWARIPISIAEGEAIMSSYVPLSSEELVSRAPFFPDEWRNDLPGSIEVFLPGKATWNALKQQVIEAKLEKLGVERGSGSSVPHIFAPHARAASISSPADPALLLFKLNKLHQTQSALALSPSIANSNSLAPSPQLPMGLSPPPQNRRPSPLGANGNFFPNRHGHTMSLAQPPSYMGSAFNPFATSSEAASIADELERPLSTVSDGGVPASLQTPGDSSASSLNVPSLSAISRPSSRPDFILGFGLDTPEEAEEEAELDEQERQESQMRWKRNLEAFDDDEEEQSEAGQHEDDESGHAGDTEEEEAQKAGEEGEEDRELDDDTASRGHTTGPHSRIHSRHASKLSAALSLRSVGGNLSAIMGSRKDGSGLEDNDDVDGDNSFMGRESSPPPQANRRPPLPSLFGHAVHQSISANREDLEDAVAVQEWTGSEEEDGALEIDLSDFDDGQSLGEYSNPSDEERARRHRVDRRMGIRAEEDKRRKLLLKQKALEADAKSDGELGEGEADKENSIDQPRRIPNFPRPPDTSVVFVPSQREHYHLPQPYPTVYPQPHHQHELGQNRDRDEIISNPSEENLVMGPHEYRYSPPVGTAMPYRPAPPFHPYPQAPQFLGISSSSSQPEFYNGVPRSPGGMRPLPMPIIAPFPHPSSHSRAPSETLSYTSHGHHSNQGSFGHLQQSSFGHGAPNLSYTHQHQNSFGQAPSAFGIISQPQPGQAHPSQTLIAGNSSARRDSLNPFAKPFVFGRPLDAKAEPWRPASATATMPTSTSTPSPISAKPQLTHSRIASLAKSLNVAAPEFKPRSAILPTDATFTFSMPTATPGFPVPETAVPLSALAAVSLERDSELYEDDGSPIKKQGREKRPRLGSARDEEDDKDVEFVEDEIIAAVQTWDSGLVDGEHSPVEEGDSMASFRFPGPAGRLESPQIIRKAFSHQPQQAQPGLGLEKTVSLDGSLREARRNNGSESDLDMEIVDSDEEDKENRRGDTPAPTHTPIVLPSLLGSNTMKEQEEGDSVGNDTEETEKSPSKPSQVAPVATSEVDEDEYVQELIIPPTLPFTNLSATFPTSATMRSTSGPIDFSPVTGSSTKGRRAPIPLDFKHPSGNTVPAGLFKALVQNVIQHNNSIGNTASATNGDASQTVNGDRTRHGARSQLGSREIYDHMRRPSMDDTNVTKISGTGIPSSKSLTVMDANANRSIHLPNFTGTVAYRGRNTTEPILSLSRQEDEEDVFGSRSGNSSQVRANGVHRRRRSSLPDALRDPPSSASPSENERDADDDSDEENQYHNSSMNGNPSHTMHLTHSGRRVLRSLSISRSESPVESSRIQHMRSGTGSRSASVRPRDLTMQLELHALEDILERVLDERLGELRREWNSTSGNGVNGTSPLSEAMLSEVISLFRTQLQDSAAKSLEDTTMEARGEMDMFIIKDMLEESQRELVGVVRTVVEEHLRQAVEAAQEARGSSRGSDEIVNELKGVVENAAGRTVRAVAETISDLRARQESARNSAHQNEALVDELVTTLTPMLSGLRPEAIDYDFLTNHLAQAVKPHISQLIDLASDKRETADLIVDALVPMLVNTLVPTLVPSLVPGLIATLGPTLVDALTEKLRTESDETRLGVVREVRRAVEGVDAIEIRERVADLVVERLDARFDARDKSFAGVVNSSVEKVLEKVSERLDAEESARREQESKGSSEENLKSVEKNIIEEVRGTVATANSVPKMLEAWFDQSKEYAASSTKRAMEREKNDEERTTETLLAIEGVMEKTPSKEDISRLEERVINVVNESALGASTVSNEIKTLLQALVAENKALVENNVDLSTSHQAMAAKLASLPETLNSSIANLQNGISELIISRDAPRKELDELKKQNSDYQIQLNKARASHGQVRVEKDLLGEKLVGVELEREKLRAKVADLEQSGNAELTAVEARKNELEEALANALGRLQASDVATQMYQQKIAELERTLKDTGAERLALKVNLDALEIRTTVAEREKATVSAMLEGVRREQGHWEGLRQASEKIDMLTKLIGEVESDEIKDLRKYHDQTKTIEADHVSLQKRYKDLENKLSNNEKVAATTKSSLLQAQQRSAEWERIAHEYEGELEMTKTKLEQAEQTQNQLEEDHSLLTIQFEEREAEDRLNKDRENKQREHIAALETKVIRLQDELVKFRTGPRTPYRNVTNGSASHPPPRPDSRASVSTVGGQKDRRLSSFSPAGTTPPTASVWDSIHAPSTDPSFPSPISKSRYSSASGVSGSIHAPKSKYPNLGPASTPKYPLPRKSGYPSTLSNASTYSRANAPSPTPSNVSAAPTQRDDGWWE